MTVNKQQNHINNTKLNGTMKISLDGSVSWTGRIIVISGGLHPDMNNVGYWDLASPTGSVAVAGGAARPVTAAAGGLMGGVLLNNWEALWYKLPLEAANTSVNANYLIVPYTATFDPDEHWVMVIARDDRNMFKSSWGDTFVIGEASGPKDVQAQLDRLHADDESFQGMQIVAPGIGAGVAGAWAYGFSSLLRRIGTGSSPLNSYIWIDIPVPAVGTVIYNVLGAPSGRTWRAPVANDRLSHFGSALASANGATLTTPLADIQPEETLFFAPDPANAGPNAGTWYVIPYDTSASSGQGFVVPSHWISVAHRQNNNPHMRVFGNRHITPGDFVAQDEVETTKAAQYRAATATPTMGLAMCAWTPNPHFNGTGLVNGGANTVYGMFLKWSGARTAYTHMSEGYAAGTGGGGGLQYAGLVMPAAGTAIPLLGTANTRVVDATMGIPLAPWETLFYIPPTWQSGIQSASTGWVVAAYNQLFTVPHNAVRVAHCVWEGGSPNGASAGAPPFAGGLSGGWAPGTKMWFLGQYLAPGAALGAIGNLGTIGTTESWRNALYGAAAGATGWAAANAVAYGAPWNIGYRVLATPSERELRMKGILRVATAQTIVPVQGLFFLPGVQMVSSHLDSVFFVSAGIPNSPPLDVRLVNVTVAGVLGLRCDLVTVCNASGSLVVPAGAYINFRTLNGTSLE